MNKKIKKKIIITSIIALTSISVLTAKKYKTINDIKNDDNHILLIDSKQDKKQGLSQRIIELIKYLLLLPLWIIGNIIIKIFDKVLKIITIPFIKILIKLLITFLILFSIILIILKLIYPEKKLRELINKKLILITFLLSLILVIVDYILIEYLDNYVLYKDIIIFILGLIGLIRIIYPFYKHKHSKVKIIYDEI